MQERYIGDIGDYFKLAMLRRLAAGRRLGVAWWLYPNIDKTNDGKHDKYLSQEHLRDIDSYIYDKLKEIRSEETKSIRSLEGLLPSGALFHRDYVFDKSIEAQRRKFQREHWFADVLDTLGDADLIFADPDNGIEPGGFSFGGQKAGKSIRYSELQRLARDGRCVIFYHHQTRFRGGHSLEIQHISQKLLREYSFGSVFALRISPVSARVYFIINANTELVERAAIMCEEWNAIARQDPRRKEDIAIWTACD